MGSAEPGAGLPAAEPRRSPLALPGVRAQGYRYTDLDPELAAALPDWLRRRGPPDATPLKAGRVFLWRGVVFKFLKPPSLARRLGGASRAVRAAELHFDLLPLRSPRPLAALRAGGRLRPTELLVSEHVAGRSLQKAWFEDERARAALPGLVAGLYERRRMHCDFHPGNLLWTGSQLVLLDLEAVRGGLHRLARRRLFETQWSALLAALRDPERLAQAHAEALRRVAPQADAAASWARIARRAQR